jgi:hypothetical protein
VVLVVYAVYLRRLIIYNKLLLVIGYVHIT